MIIVEGPDGSGKTTFCLKLSEITGRPYMRPSKDLLSSTTGPGVGLDVWWSNELEGKKKLGIYDRSFWISDPIYGAVLHRPIDYKTINRMICQSLSKVDYLIFALPEFEKILATFDEREQLRGMTKESLRTTYDLYQLAVEMWKKLEVNVLVYDWTNEAKLIRIILNEELG